MIKLFSPSFYVLKNRFNLFSIAVRFVTKMHTEFEQSSGELRCAINEEIGVFNVVLRI